MDFFIQAMTQPGNRRPNNNSPNLQSRPSQPRPNRNQEMQSRNDQYQGGYNPSYRPNPPQRPSPPPIINPNIPHHNPRFPPPPPQNFPNPRHNQHQTSPDNSPSYNQGRPQRGRFNPQRNYGGPEAIQDNFHQHDTGRGRYEQQNEQPERQQNFNKNYQRGQGRYNARSNDFNGYQNERRNVHNDRGPRGGYQQEGRGYRGDPQEDRNYRGNNQNQDNRRFQDNRPDNRQERNYSNRGRRGQPQERQPYRNRDRGADRRQSDERQPKQQSRDNQNYRGRGGYRGRGRGRGQPQNLNPYIEERQAEKQLSQQSQRESLSMEMEGSMSEQQQPSASESASPSIQNKDNESQIQSEEEVAEGSEIEQSASYQSQQKLEQEEGSMPQISDSGSADMQRIDTMVSKEQYNERVETFKMNNRNRDGKLVLDTGRSFAIFEINKRTMEPDLSLALKRFRRSTNRGEDQDQKDQTSDCPRSRKGLGLTIKHIHKEIIDADGMRPKDLAFPLPPGEKHFQFLHIYDFLWNRMRQMIKDVARLNQKQRGTQQIVVICQQMLRFFIIAVREGRLPHKCRLDFDSKMNLQSITKILTQLLQIYEMAHYKVGGASQSNTYISPNEPEILGYAIIISNDLQNTINDKLRVRLSGDGLDHPLVNTVEIQTALRIKKAIKNRDFQTFYRILESKQTDYVQACLLIHSLPTVRRETLRVLQKACEPDMQTKLKKIPLSILRNSLRFSYNLQNEFSTFLDNIGARITNQNGQNIVWLSGLNQSLEDFKQSFAFDFGYKKTDRQNYPDCKGKSHLVEPNKISREQLIKRSWYYGTYLNDCAEYYNRAEIASKVKPKPKSPFVKQSEKAPQPEPQVNVTKPEQKKQSAQMNLNFLMEKRKQFNRSRFLKNLELLVQTLVRRSDVHSQHQRKKGIAMIVEFMEILKTMKQKEAFDKILEFNQYKLIIYETLQNLSSFAQTRQKFINSYYVGTNELSKFRSGKSYRKLSNAVNPKTKKQADILTQIIKIAGKNPLPKLINVLVLFASSGHLELNLMHIKFLKNIFKFLACDTSRDQSYLDRKIQNICQNLGSQPYIQIKKTKQHENEQFEYRLKLMNYRVDRSEPPFLCGYDKIILLDLHGEPKVFVSLLRQMEEKRKKTMLKILGQIPKMKTTIANIIVCPVDKFKKKNNSNSKEIQQWSTRWNYLQMESNKLSLPLKHSIMQVLTSDLSNSRSTPLQYETVTIEHLISQIYQNMQYAEGIHPYPSSLDFFQQYFKANLNFLCKTYKNIVKNYQTTDWTKILYQAAYIREIQSKQSTFSPQMESFLGDQKINLNELLSKKFIFCYQIMNMLRDCDLIQKFNILRKERPYFNNHQILAATVQQYLQEFSKNQRLQNLEAICQYVIQNNCDLIFKQNTIQGNAESLISYIINQLKKQLKYLTIILPKGFKFQLNKKEFHINHQNQSKNIANQKSQQSVTTRILPKLKYQYQDLLSKLRKQTNTETEDLEYSLPKSGRKQLKV